jgi:hypothetical protein
MLVVLRKGLCQAMRDFRLFLAAMQAAVEQDIMTTSPNTWTEASGLHYMAQMSCRSPSLSSLGGLLEWKGICVAMKLVMVAYRLDRFGLTLLL